MIEAYEIGIKLALQDGVSEGITTIRRDLGSLDQAIAQTALRLGQLQQIGAQALMASQEQPRQVMSSPPVRKPALPATPSLLAEPESVTVPAEVQAINPAQSSSPRPPIDPPVAVAVNRAMAGQPNPMSPAIMPRLDVAAPAAAARAPAIIVDAARVFSAPSLPEQPAATSPTGAVVMASSPPVAATPRLIAPVLQTADTWRQKEDRPQEPTPTRPAGAMFSGSKGATVPPRQISIEPARREKVRQTGHRHSDAREVETRGPTPAVAVLAARVTAVPAKSPIPVSAASPMAPSASPSYAPPAVLPRAKETSMRGDVFFDGARVGRWISEQMARDAGRPNTGPTGFDPRRSPAWPGAAVTW